MLILISYALHETLVSLVGPLIRGHLESLTTMLNVIESSVSFCAAYGQEGNTSKETLDKDERAACSHGRFLILMARTG